MVPLAMLLGKATEDIAEHTNETLGALVNVTFGNAVELILSISALRAGRMTLIQDTIAGSVLSNLLLVLGSAFFFGGLRYREQMVLPAVSEANADLLSFAVFGFSIPALFAFAIPDNEGKAMTEEKMSLVTSICLLCMYAMYLTFQLYTHAELYEGIDQEADEEAGVTEPHSRDEQVASLPVASAILVGMVLLVAICSERKVHCGDLAAGCGQRGGAHVSDIGGAAQQDRPVNRAVPGCGVVAVRVEPPDVEVSNVRDRVHWVLGVRGERDAERLAVELAGRGGARGHRDDATASVGGPRWRIVNSMFPRERSERVERVEARRARGGEHVRQGAAPAATAATAARDAAHGAAAARPRGPPCVRNASTPRAESAPCRQLAARRSPRAACEERRARAASRGASRAPPGAVTFFGARGHAAHVPAEEARRRRDMSDAARRTRRARTRHHVLALFSAEMCAAPAALPRRPLSARSPFVGRPLPPGRCLLCADTRRGPSASQSSPTLLFLTVVAPSLPNDPP
ncbi:Sodium/calcium exchanger protein [Gracilaria domingensis]|nr:Sodium/calcium exchanger protein [Gracilaria domingensis]